MPPEIPHSDVETVRVRLEPVERVPKKEHRSLPRSCSRHRPALRLLTRPGLRRYSALVRDVSQRGIGLLLQQSLEPGTMVVIELPRRHTGFSGILSGQVRHATLQADGCWLVGCSLTRSLSEEELNCLLSDFTSAKDSH
jgi:hypothetical protein